MYAVYKPFAFINKALLGIDGDFLGFFLIGATAIFEVLRYAITIHVF